jgi:hypothetical protein
MMVKLARKQVFKKSAVVLICLMVVGNLAPGIVLCFGADGHIEIESAFHKRCDDSVHTHSSDHNRLSDQAGHEEGKHCEPCIDVPLSIGFAKISRVSKQLNPTFPVSATNVTVVTDKLDFVAYNSVPNFFISTSYFSPLRTVVLLL